MQASNWEFKNRALVFGLIFAIASPLYSVDRQNAVAALANWLGASFEANPDSIARFLFAVATLLVVAAAFVRTWASSYLNARVVYASDVRTESLVADGPYRLVRNPLYFANVLMAAGMGAMLSRLGFVVTVAAMLLFCFRLIFREEADLEATQGERYAAYRLAVPRLWPALWPRIPSSGRRARWMDGFKAEFWYWGIAAAVGSFALTLNFTVFLVILGASVLLFWVSSTFLARRPEV